MKFLLSGIVFFVIVIPSLSFATLVSECVCKVTSQNADPQLTCPESDSDRTSATNANRDIGVIRSSENSSTFEATYPYGIAATCAGTTGPEVTTQIARGTLSCDVLGDNCSYKGTTDKGAAIVASGCPSVSVNTVALQQDTNCSKQLSVAGLEASHKTTGTPLKKALAGGTSPSGATGGGSTAGTVINNQNPPQ